MTSPYWNRATAYQTWADQDNMGSESFTRFSQRAQERDYDNTHQFSSSNDMPFNNNKEVKVNNMKHTAWIQNHASTPVTTSTGSELCRSQPIHLEKYPEHQTIEIPYQRENQYPTRDMEILIHVNDDIITFVRKVKEKVNSDKRSKVWLPAPQYIDYFQKIKYAFNLLGKISSYLDESIVRGSVSNFFQSLEYVTYYCPDYKTLPRQVNCPLLTDKAIQLLNATLKQSHISYWKDLGTAWTVTRDSWPKTEPVPPAYTPTFYDGWQLPDITHLEPIKMDVKTQVEQQLSRLLYSRPYFHSSLLESTPHVVPGKKDGKVTRPLEFQSHKRPQGLSNPAYT